MKKYYPSGYRKKKKHENVQRLVVYFTVAIVVCGIAIFAGYAVVKMFKPGTPEQGTVELANAQEQIDRIESEREADLNPPLESPVQNNTISESATINSDAEKPTIFLKDITDFEQSFPEIGVMLLSSSDATSTETEDVSKPEENKGETLVEDSSSKPDVPPPASTRPGPPVSRDPDDESSTGNDTSLSHDSASGNTSDVSSNSTSKNNNANGSGSSGSTSGSGGVSGKYIYTVYAGTWDKEDTATRKLDELAGVGYAAQIIENNFAGEKSYKILVKSKIEDYDKAKEIQADLKAKGFTDASIYKDKL